MPVCPAQKEMVEIFRLHRAGVASNAMGESRSVAMAFRD